MSCTAADPFYSYSFSSASASAIATPWIDACFAEILSEMGAPYTQQQPPAGLLASAPLLGPGSVGGGAAAPHPVASVAAAAAVSGASSASSAASAASSTTGSQQQQQQHHHHQHRQHLRKSHKLGENIVMLLCLGRVRRMGGRWYRAVSHMRTGKRKKEKKRLYRAADYARLREASDAAMDMSEAELAEIVANLLKKIFKEIQEDYKEAFVRSWLHEDDRCVLTVPDGKGKMKRIDGLRGSDKVWRLDTLVAMLYHGVPMDSTDTGLLVHRCEDELCVNPRHLSFQCSPAMMAVAMEMLRVAGYDLAGVPAAAAAAAAASVDTAGGSSCRYFQFTSPFTVDVIRREMSESMDLPAAVLDRYQLSPEDATFVQDNFPETMAAYRSLLDVGGSGGGADSGGVVGGDSGSGGELWTRRRLQEQQRASGGGGGGSGGGGSLVQSLQSPEPSSTVPVTHHIQHHQYQQQHQHHQGLVHHHQLQHQVTAAGLVKSEAVSPASCSSASATPSSAASAAGGGSGGGGIKRPPSESPTNSHMPLKKRRPLSSTDFTTDDGGGYGVGGTGSGGYGGYVSIGSAGLSASGHDQRPSSDEALKPAGAAGTAGSSSHYQQHQQPPHLLDAHNQSVTEEEVAAINRSSGRVADAASALASMHQQQASYRNSPCPEYGGYSIFTQGLYPSDSTTEGSSSSSAGAGAATAVASVGGAAAAAASASVSGGKIIMPAPPLPRPRPLVPSLDGTLTERETASLPVGQAAQHIGGFRPIPALLDPRRSTPVGHSPLSRNDTPTAIKIILELQSAAAAAVAATAAASASSSSAGSFCGSGDTAASSTSAASATSATSAGAPSKDPGGRGQLRGIASIDHFEHILRAKPGATPTFMLTGGGAGGPDTSASSPLKQAAAAAAAAGSASVGNSASAAKSAPLGHHDGERQA